MAISGAATPHRNIVRLIYAASALIVLLFAASNIFVLHQAGTIAEDLRKTVEENLVKNEIHRQLELLAHDQSQISHWDKTVEALDRDEMDDFVEDEITDWLWDDFGIHTTVIVAVDGTPRVTVIRQQRVHPDAGAELVEANRDLIETTRARYMAARKRRGNGYYIPDHPVRSDRPLYVADLRKAHGMIGVLVAQTIVPDDDAVLPEGYPHILLTFKPFNAEVFSAIEQKLGLTGFRIVEAGTDLGSVDGERTRLAIPIVEGGQLFEAVWQPAAPAKTIWHRALPHATILMAVVVLILLVIVWRYARTLRALQASEEENRRLAFHDALTGLPNRLQFDEALEQIINAGAAERCAILCLDLDRFKAVNDTYGHHAGDAVIVAIARRIAAAVGPNGMAARVGGDEFIILLRQKLDRDAVLWLCDALIESVCEPIALDGGTASVGASIGVAWWPEDGRAAKTVMRNADEALYRAKERGRGRTVCADDLRQDSQERQPRKVLAPATRPA
ncbi:diguanylate cyclase domain-containing protein [Rhodobium gokarnense]|uniref:Diguanylate cyclase (GGDEF)-like protein n=1 Tax=Rhodobium gokarnense TaxID=364296 RepID=A0ABT3HD82_9HYPH|nr:diguanylate cyclase [Rhodobium gokarnense]MCW2308363.1 diguanylate cyclase (GGDEF)-like protein [Rhodobium gokarnense]